MNCPKCPNALGLDLHIETLGMVCPYCGWRSDTLEALVAASPAYRLAKLKADGAEPGWYGPDGERWEFCVDAASLNREGHGFCTDSPEKMVAFARLCGFVEVTMSHAFGLGTGKTEAQAGALWLDELAPAVATTRPPNRKERRAERSKRRRSRAKPPQRVTDVIHLELT